MTAGASSHKTVTRSWLLTFYYWRPCLTFVCSLNEICFLTFYLRAFGPGPSFFDISLYNLMLMFALPVCALKQIVSIRQIASAHGTIAETL